MAGARLRLVSRPLRPVRRRIGAGRHLTGRDNETPPSATPWPYGAASGSLAKALITAMAAFCHERAECLGYRGACRGNFLRKGQVNVSQ